LLKLLATSIVTSTAVWPHQAIRIRNDGVELMSSDDLKPHVGHKVRVTGMMQGESAMSDDKMSTDSMSKDRMSKDSLAASGFKVTSMNMRPSNAPCRTRW
jgi:hypothetical protein